MLDGEHEINDIWFDDVHVPAHNLVGEENKGWTYAKFLLTHERTNNAGIGNCKRALEEAQGNRGRARLRTAGLCSKICAFATASPRWNSS